MVSEPEEEEGGPVKSFLEHLEDLRWTLIKSLVTVAIAMLICLIAGDRVVSIVKRPLEKARTRHPGTNQVVTLFFGTNRVGTFNLDHRQQRELSFGPDRFVGLQIEPVTVGTNLLLGVRVDTNSAVARAAAERMQIDLVNLSPAGGFFVAFQMAMYGGLVLASPFVFYFIAQFVFPALRLREKKYVYGGLGFGVVLFATGVSFCYFILLPVALSASQLYSQWLGFGAFQWRAEDYISFVCKFMLGMGLGFQLPVVILTLVKLGVLNYRILSKGRRYMIVINLVLGAFLTTPEIVTQVMMALPLQLLYEITVWIAWYWERREKRRLEASAPAGESLAD
jgi:sec-independent protein translocase protein TatC